jgi:hypothetical protein
MILYVVPENPVVPVITVPLKSRAHPGGFVVSEYMQDK